MTQEPRVFRFSLRTLLVVVTVVCVWLGWQLSIVRQRRAKITELEGRHWVFVGGDDSSLRYRAGFERRNKFPDFRRWLGDQPIFCIGIQADASAVEVHEISALFPEALLKNL